MRKKWLRLLIIAVPVLAFIAFTWIRFILLHSGKNNEGTANQTATSPIDLRPAIIAKLQSLVKTGSNGLYDLSIQQIQPDITSMTVDIINAKLIPNVQALKLLDSLHKAPDDVFTVSLDSLHISGIDPGDLLHTSDIRFDSIVVSKPVITCDHQPRSYNQIQREKEKGETLYQKLAGQIKSVNIQSIIIKQCTYISKQKNKQEKIFNDVTMKAGSLQIDSSTQFDKQRVFFSKKLTISCSNFISRTADSLYLFKIGAIEINATDHSLMASKVALIPRGNIAQFEKKLRYRNNRFDMVFPKVVAKNIDWWALTNNESFSGDEIEIYNATIRDYVDRRLPSSPNDGNTRDFPHQLLLEVPAKISIKTLKLHGLNVSYEEVNPASNKSGTVTFNNINGSITNISNIPAVMNAYGHTIADIEGSFMHSVPARVSFSFDLERSRTGNFSMHMTMGQLDKEIINPIAEPLGLFSVKTGTITKADTRVEGDNYTSNVHMLMLYNDLHLTPLKKSDGGDTSLHKKAVTGFLANVFIIKNNNPAHGDDPRSVNVMVTRDSSEAFFGFAWKSILAGILKTTGIPEKYANR